MARKIRIAVGSPAAMHSAVWTIWTQGDELYLASAQLAGLVKVSVHASGIVRTAMPSGSTTDFGRHSDPRVIDRWKIAAVGEEEWTICFQLFVPGVYIPNRFSAEVIQPSRRASVRWLAPPAIGHARIVLLVRARTAEQHISECLFGEFEVLETLALRSGGAVWVVAYDQALTEADVRSWQSQASKTSFGDDPDNMAFATLVTGDHRHSLPNLREVALGRNNFRSDAKSETDL